MTFLQGKAGLMRVAEFITTQILKKDTAGICLGHEQIPVLLQ
jgi:hypothetical protein